MGGVSKNNRLEADAISCRNGKSKYTLQNL